MFRILPDHLYRHARRRTGGRAIFPTRLPGGSPAGSNGPPSRGRLPCGSRHMDKDRIRTVMIRGYLHHSRLMYENGRLISQHKEDYGDDPDNEGFRRP